MSNASSLPHPTANALRLAALLLAFLPGAIAPRPAHGLPRQNAPGNPPAQPSPADKIRQYMKFIDQRMNEIHAITSNPGTPNAAAQLRDKMEEVTRLCDNLQDSLQTYDQQHVDLRKQLKDLVPASAHWSDFIGAVPTEAASDFTHKMAVQAVTSTHALAVRLQTSQEQYFASHKQPG